MGTYFSKIRMINDNTIITVIFIKENAFENGGHFGSASVC